MTTTSLGKRPNTSGFAFPQIHSFPPFYTLQPNPTSRAQQLNQWRSLILDYCRFYRIFTLSASPTTTLSSTVLDNASIASTDPSASDPWKSLFVNPKIQRQLSSEAVRQIFADLVAHQQASWEDVPQTKSSMSSSGLPTGSRGNKILVYWKTPAQWGDAIYEWVMQTGQNKSIMTLFELSQGDLVQGQEFYNLPTPLLRQALKYLSTQGKAQIFAGTEAEDGEGVKFV